jgi:hypothetical protein
MLLGGVDPADGTPALYFIDYLAALAQVYNPTELKRALKGRLQKLRDG